MRARDVKPLLPLPRSRCRLHLCRQQLPPPCACRCEWCVCAKAATRRVQFPTTPATACWLPTIVYKACIHTTYHSGLRDSAAHPRRLCRGRFQTLARRCQTPHGAPVRKSGQRHGLTGMGRLRRVLKSRWTKQTSVYSYRKRRRGPVKLGDQLGHEQRGTVKVWDHFGHEQRVDPCF